MMLIFLYLYIQSVSPLSYGNRSCNNIPLEKQIRRLPVNISKLCKVQIDPGALISRCLENKQPSSLQILNKTMKSIECPNPPRQFRRDTFNIRARNGYCDKHGMWSPHHLNLMEMFSCVSIVIGEKLKLKPNMKVFDWGSGCGHKMTWWSDWYGIDAFGIEYQREAVKWARTHSMGNYCNADGSKLDWVPSDFFDVVFSYGGICTLPLGKQCYVMKELLRIAKPGGIVVNGWNGYFARLTIGRNGFRDCFMNVPGADLEIWEDREVYGEIGDYSDPNRLSFTVVVRKHKN